MNKHSLTTYRDRRDFRRSPEPSGKASADAGGQPFFVIQQHDATQMHYDFRLEIDGVLKSWAVPKGPSTDPRVKRLAVETEDHPLEYADFEGAIPADQYGGGTVLVWDAGPYHNASTDKDDHAASMETAYQQGKITVELEGKKLKGGYHLIRTRQQGDKPQWLLIKRDDDHADARRNPVSTEPHSVLSGRTLKQVAQQEADSHE